MIDELNRTDTAAPPAQAGARRDRFVAEAKDLLVLAGPLVFTQLAQMAILATDVVLLGRLSTQALAAAAIGNTVYYFCWLIGSGPASAVSPLVAQLIGARPKARAGVRRIVRMGLWGAILLSLPLVPILLSSHWILAHLGQDPELARGAGLFTAMLCVGLPFSFGFQVLRNFATALGKPNAALWVMLSSILFNGLVAWTLIFGHFGLPKLGLVGAGMATSMSAIWAFVLMLIVVRATPTLRRYRVLRRFGRPIWRTLREILTLGMPIGVTMLFEAMLFNAMTLVVGTFGSTPLAAHQVALNFASVTFMIPMGVAMAATVRVGRFAGAGDREGARRAGFVAMIVGAGLISLFGVLMFFQGDWIAGLYIAGREPDDLKVIALAALFLKVAAAFQLVDALQVVGAQSLRGLKDARTPMILAGVSYWLFGAPMCVFLGVYLGMQGLGVWIGLAFGLAVAAVAMCLRFHLLTRTKLPL
ncbi:MATE family efflux transporter [Caulobacter mirabilis]|uniref:Multidrug-efflux transporter n=1 Tax=Caulobacter mirabilis TaxID=69666 RepID=A0A2D2B0C3_9CAUL|nr:MATE family efflux transporter [Caulobacter mirabilis]ATQ43705.1 MATE family efflux transporter [Caulobacter mirabilis]